MWFRIVAMLAVVSIPWSSTYGAPSRQRSSDIDQTLKKLEIFAKALNYVEANYIKDVSTEELIDGAIHGMLRTLDPHTLYLPPEQFSRMRVDTAGEYGGLGIDVVVEEKGIVVVTPIEGSPAFRAGIKPGDVILEIDGKSTQGMNQYEAQKMLQGKNSTTIKLLVQEKATGITRLIELTREKIKLQSVTSRKFSSVGYIKITNFQEKTTNTVKNRILTMLEKEKQLEGLILDLRNNPGGLLGEAVELVDLFIDKGNIVSIRGRRKEYIETRRASKVGTLTTLPMVTLINGGTASAPEIVAGALKDHRRSVIMGTRSFGKGSVQTVIDLDDGSGLKLTVANFFTPKGHHIQARGITPNIVVDPETPDAFHVVDEITVREEDLKNHLKSAQGAPDKKGHGIPSDDLQLLRAFDHLKAWVTFSKTPTVKAKAKGKK